VSSVGLYPGLESATHIAPYTEPFDEVVLGKSQAITPLSERLKVDFALIDQNIANQILWLVSHAPSLVVHGFFYESKFETGCVAGAAYI